MSDLSFDPVATIDFLHHFRPDGPWVITAIKPEKKGLDTKTFDLGEEPAMAAWIKSRPAEENIYFTPNPLRWKMNGPGAKPRLADVAAMAWLHIDIDPRATSPDTDMVEHNRSERARILALLTTKRPAGIPKPTVIIDSGGGYQAFWKLDEPVPINGDEAVAKDMAGYNLRLEVLLGGDRCHSLEHLMRLAGSVNAVDQKKRAKGRENALARVVEADWSLSYPLSAFAKMATRPPKPVPERAAPVGQQGVMRLKTIDDLDRYAVDERTKAITVRAKAIIVDGRLRDFPKPGDDSRSQWVFDVLCELLRAKVPDDLIHGIVTDPRFHISESVLKNPNDVWRRLDDAKAEVARDDTPKGKEESSADTLKILNRRHAVLLQEGSKCRVLSWERTELDGGRLVPVLQSFEDFRNRYMNRFVDVQTLEGVKRMPWGRWWLEHKNRREYLGFRFLPGEPEEVAGGPDDDANYLNLWRGFAVTPAPGDWSQMKAHIVQVLAAGDAVAAEYILRWAAFAVQHPDEPAEVAVVFKGDKGSGKGLFGRTMRRMFGQHGFQINSSKHLTGNFNAHLRDCCLLFADEAIVPGDKNAESILKGLITEPELAIEGKGVNLVQARNRLHVVMASNHSWVVPATIDERRFAIFDVPGWRIGDGAYFSAVFRQLDDGGRAAMLHDLLEMELGDWHPRQNVPKTDGRYKQIAASFHGIEQVMFDLLRVGEIPIEEWVTDQQPFVATSTLQAYAQRVSGRNNISGNAVANLLTLLGAQKDRSRRPSGYILRSLAETRVRWSEEKVPYPWADLSEQWSALPGSTGVMALRDWEKKGEAAPVEDEPPF